jgi:Zn-dependent M28 family amino/carboxypeptidase
MEEQHSRLYEDVRYLTAIRPFRNCENPDSLKTASDYIRAELQVAGLQVEDQSWMADGIDYTNLIATFNAGKPKRLVVGAHYDVCGDQPGADDNASAVAGLLETTRLLGENKPALDYQIDLVAFCLEEPPFFDSQYMGSYVHAQHLYNNNIEVIGMLCYEMIGYFSDQPGSQSFPADAYSLADQYPNIGDFIMVVGKADLYNFNSRIKTLMADQATVDVQQIDFPANEGLANMSDHINYWKFGYPALMINDTSFLRNPNYHLPTDTADTLDYPKMTEVVNGAYHAITNLSA